MKDKIDAVMETIRQYGYAEQLATSFACDNEDEKSDHHTEVAKRLLDEIRAAIEQLAQAKGFGEDSIEQRCMQEFRLRCELSEHIGKLNALAEKCGFEGAETALTQLAPPAQGEAVAWRFRLRGAESWIPSCDEVGAKKLLANSECYEVEPLYALPPDTVPKAEYDRVVARVRELESIIEYITPALPVLRNELKRAGLMAGANKAEEMLATINSLQFGDEANNRQREMQREAEHTKLMAALSAQPSDEVKS